MNYYNDNEPYVVRWLQNLIEAHLLPDGYADEKNIENIKPDELVGFKQCHFFAGIGGWAYALQLANWPADREVWTGSCPCQPFSIAGKQKGIGDKRHLWPIWYEIIKERRPATIFGEQVTSPLGREWLARVQIDLEALDYGFGAADLCAAGVAAPHIRQRLFWVADTGRGSDEFDRFKLARETFEMSGETREQRFRPDARNGSEPSRMAKPSQQRRCEGESLEIGQSDEFKGSSTPCRMGNSNTERLQGRDEHIGKHTNKESPWTAGEFIFCADGKQRRVELGVFPLAHGVSCRVGKLRSYGNSIVPQVAAEFIRAYLEGTESPLVFGRGKDENYS